jgi:archaellum component FlaD/FlaE
MIKIGRYGKMKGKDDDSLLLGPQDLEEVLQDFIKKKMVSERVATKIIAKIREKNISLNKDELVKLVKTIQNSTKNTVEIKKKTIGVNKTSNVTEKQSGNQDAFDQQLKQTFDSNAEFIKELNHELTTIGNKIEHIEENQKQMFNSYTQPTAASEQYPEKYQSQCFLHHKISDHDFGLDEDMEPLCEIRNTAENVVLLMRWLQYLIDKLGQNNLSEILDYYVNINWITEDVRLDLIKYAKGITFQEDTSIKDSQKNVFTIDDHLQSFMFIQKLKGTKFQEDYLLKINSKIDKMGKTFQQHLV